MTVESASYISGLDATLPAASGPVSEGDDHLRLLKSALKATFPNANGAINPTPTEFNRLVGLTGTIHTSADFSIGDYSTTAEANALYLSEAGGDARYLRKSVDQTFTGAVLTGDGTSGIRLQNVTAVSLASTGHAFQIGLSSGQNVAFGNDDIQSRNNGAAATLHLNQNGGEVRAGGNLIMTTANGGSGTNFDADKVDGLEASQFIRSDAADVKTSGTLTFNDNVSLGFGTSNGEATMYSNGSALYLAMANDKDFYILDNGTSRFLFDSSAGHFHADGNGYFYSTSVGSDRKLKKYIKRIADASAKIDLLKGVQFLWKRDNAPDAGLIAQDVLKVLPELVTEVPNMSKRGTHLNLNYNGIIGLLVEGFKEQKERADKLEARLAKLEKLLEV